MASFVKFDPDKWDPREPEAAAKVAKAAKVGGGFATLASLASLPDELSDGLRRLGRMAPPRAVNAEAWSESVADGERIVSGGWAAQALALGWSALDLFGGIPEADGDPGADGLAVWLSGRKLALLSPDGAVAFDTVGRRHYFVLPRALGARLLWTMGHGAR